MNPWDCIPLFVLAKTIKPNYNYEITVQRYGASFDSKTFRMLRLCKLFLFEIKLLIISNIIPCFSFAFYLDNKKC